MKVLVLGYYGRNNLGDEMFKETFPLMFPKCILTFDLIESTIPVDSYDAIIVGGGDVINSYFHPHLVSRLTSFSGPIFAYSIGLPYPNLVECGYLDLFDHVFLRNLTDTRRVQKRIGTLKSHYLPDLGFLLPSPEILPKRNDIPKIGIFLIPNLEKSEELTKNLTSFLTTLSNHCILIFYRFNTSGKHEDDEKISTLLYNKLSHPNVFYDSTIYDCKSMVNQMSKLDFGICFRFHSHVFMTVAGIPFLSCSTTRKTKLFMEENKLTNYCINSINDGNDKPISFDENELNSKFNSLMINRYQITQSLIDITLRNKRLLNTQQPQTLLFKTKKRMRNVFSMIDSVYEEIRSLFLTETNYDISSGPPTFVLPENVIELAANKMCYLVTGIPDSSYVFGSIQNIRNSPQSIRDMIEWISSDFHRNKEENENRINLEYISQNSMSGLHRSGWPFVIESMTGLSGNNGVICDVYGDRTFCWCEELLRSEGILPYTSNWIAFLHHTAEQKYSPNNLITVFSQKSFHQSLPTCRGIFVLSNYLKTWVRNQLDALGYSNILVETLVHPTEFVDKEWSFDSYVENGRRMTQVGWWLREPFTLYAADVPYETQKCALRGPRMDSSFPPNSFTVSVAPMEYKDKFNTTSMNRWLQGACDFLNSSDEGTLTKIPLRIEEYKPMNHEETPTTIFYSNLLEKYQKSVVEISKLNNDDYDKLLVTSILFLRFVDVSACNTLLEAAVRNTPIVVNRHPAVVEVFGSDYPLYYESPKDIHKLLTDSQIQKANVYLSNLPKEKYRIESFLKSLKNSRIYGSLNA